MSTLQSEVDEARAVLEAAAAMRAQAEEAELVASRNLEAVEQRLRAATFSPNATVEKNHYRNFSMSSTGVKPVLEQGERVHAKQEGEARWGDWKITKKDGSQVTLNWEMVATHSVYAKRRGLMALVLVDEVPS